MKDLAYALCEVRFSLLTFSIIQVYLTYQYILIIR
jgi:hypothetical protein